MEAEKKTRLHPLVAGAAGGVIIASALAIAAIGGYLPGSSAKTQDSQAAAQPAKPAHKACIDCGVVLAVTEVNVMGHGSGVGAVAGGVAGAVLGHEIGDGSRAGTAVGAVVGGVAGHQIERQARSAKRYDISVRMSDGSVKVLSTDTPPAVRNGERVHVREGRVVPVSARG